MAQKIRQLFSMASLLLSLPLASYAGTQHWNLQQSLQQAITSSPELQQSLAEIGAREENVKSASLWPDPDIELRVDNSLQRERNSSGYDLAEITLSQAIPWSRLEHQKSVASAQLSAAQHQQLASSLDIQNRVAHIYYELQRASELLKLAEQRVTFADRLRQNNQQGSNAVVRYLTPLEKVRLQIIREQAHQSVVNAEGKYNEALTEFYKILGIDANMDIQLDNIQEISQVPALLKLQQQQNQHPLIFQQKLQLQAASNAIDLARSNAIDDPTISLSRSRGVFNNDEESVYGLMLNLQIPLQDRKNSAVSKARYGASQQRIELSRMQRELQINLQRSHAHLNHLVEQANNYRQRVLKPAQRVLELSQQGFKSGELGVLSLVDANNTFFDAKQHYLELLYQSQQELADIKLYAGLPQVDTLTPKEGQ